MPYCNSCGTQVDTSSNFCRRCGARIGVTALDSSIESAFDSISQRLIIGLDIVREDWFNICKQFVSLKLSSEHIVNTDFASTRVVSITAERRPSSFPFESVDGSTVEAGIICWQYLNSLGFANGKSYISTQQLPLLSESLVRSIKPGTPWVIAIGALCVLSSCPPIDDTCISQVLAHYLLSDPTPSRSVREAQPLIEESLSLLRHLCYRASAAAFGDQVTESELIAQAQELFNI